MLVRRCTVIIKTPYMYMYMYMYMYVHTHVHTLSMHMSVFTAVFDESGNFLIFASMVGIKGA